MKPTPEHLNVPTHEYYRLCAIPDAVLAEWRTPAGQLDRVCWWYLSGLTGEWRPCHGVNEAAWRAMRGETVSLEHPSDQLGIQTAVFACAVAASV